MKKILSTILSFVIVCSLHAQNFEVVDTQSTIKGRIGQIVTSPIKIKNNTDRPLQLVVKRLTKVVGTSQNTYFCWDNDCYPESTSQMPISKKLDAGEVSVKLKSVLETGLVAGFSTVKYLIYDRDNPTDAVEHEIAYTIEDESIKETIYNSDDLQINDVYPNPVVDFAIFDYNLHKEDIEAKIVIHNVLGSVIGEYKLNYLETKLKVKTEDFNAGVYFYTLYIDNDGIMTRKLVVRK